MTPDRERNAIIMAAGTSSRFVPLSSEIPKGLLEVKGEILIERQIRQLNEAGVDDITIVVGYLAHKFEYLRGKYGVDIVFNDDYHRYNNTSSLIRVVDRLKNTFVCSSDNYFPVNVFLTDNGQGYYSAKYSTGDTSEYCLNANKQNEIVAVTIGGKDEWYMIGHVYFSEDFSKSFAPILIEEYKKRETRLQYWEDVYIKHINQLPKLQLRKYKDNEILEFDTIDELRAFDKSYIENTRSSVIKHIAGKLNCKESELYGFNRIQHSDTSLLFLFRQGDNTFQYDESGDRITLLK